MVSGNMVTDAAGNTVLQLNLNMAERHYCVTMASQSEKGAFIDRGANGGLAGADMRVIKTVFGSTVDVTGVGDATMLDLPIVQAASLIQTKSGPIIAYLTNMLIQARGALYIVHSKWNRGESRSMRHPKKLACLESSA
jgi:hypothetical protein